MGRSASSAIELLKERSTKDPAGVAKKRLVPVESVIGVSTGDIRKLARQIGHDANLAEALWLSPFIEAKALAILVLPPSHADDALLARWLSGIQDWSTCDLFVKTLVVKRKDAVETGRQWAASPDLYTRRAGLALIANYCMRTSAFDDETSLQIRDTIEAAASDDRDHVRQACCWALKEFGKSNVESHEEACVLAVELSDSTQASRRWVGRCANRELEDLIKVPQRRRLISRRSKTGLQSSEK